MKKIIMRKACFLALAAAAGLAAISCNGGGDILFFLSAYEVKALSNRVTADPVSAIEDAPVVIYSIGGTPTVKYIGPDGQEHTVTVKPEGETDSPAVLALFGITSGGATAKKYSFRMPKASVTVNVSSRQEGDAGASGFLTRFTLLADEDGQSAELYDDPSPSPDVHGPLMIDTEGILMAKLEFASDASLSYSVDSETEYEQVPFDGIIMLTVPEAGEQRTVRVRGRGAEDSVLLYTYIFKKGSSADYVKSGDNSLQELRLAVGDEDLVIAPEFSPSVTAYTASAGDVDAVLVYAKRNHSMATLSLNGSGFRNNTWKLSSLNVGTNEISVLVKAENGDERAYVITITRGTSGSYSLSSLVIDEYPAFVPDMTVTGTGIVYDLKAADGYSPIPAASSLVKMTPVLADKSAQLFMKEPGASSFTEITSGLKKRIYLSESGANVVEFEVRAPGGETGSSYSVTVYRTDGGGGPEIPGGEDGSGTNNGGCGTGNAGLAALAVTYNIGSANSPFAGAPAWVTGDYDLRPYPAPNEADSVRILATPADSSATIMIDGNPIIYGLSARVELSGYGAEYDMIVVGITSGGVTNSYKVYVTRAARNDATIKSLSIKDQFLDQPFVSATTDYTMTVEAGVTGVRTEFLTNDASATFTLTGATWNETEACAYTTIRGSGPDHVTTVTITVKAQDKVTTKVYTLAIMRLTNSDATLKEVSVDSGKIEAPDFDRGNPAVSYNGGQQIAGNRRSVSVNAKAYYESSMIKMAPYTGSSIPDDQYFSEVAARYGYSWTLVNDGDTPNKLAIRCIAESGAKIDYTLTIYREVLKSDEKGILSIKAYITGSGNMAVYDTYTRVYPFAVSDITEYSLYTTAANYSVGLSVVTKDTKAHYSGSGPYNISGYNISTGAWDKTTLANNIKITVTAEDGTVKDYFIKSVVYTPFDRVPIAKGGAVSFVGTEEIHVFDAPTHGSDNTTSLDFLGYSSYIQKTDYVPVAGSGTGLLLVGGGGDGGAKQSRAQGGDGGGGGAGGGVLGTPPYMTASQDIIISSYTDQSTGAVTYNTATFDTSGLIINGFKLADEVVNGKVSVVVGGGGSRAASGSFAKGGGDTVFGKYKALGGDGGVNGSESEDDDGKGGAKAASASGRNKGGRPGLWVFVFDMNVGGGGGASSVDDGKNSTEDYLDSYGGNGGYWVNSSITGTKLGYGLGGMGGTSTHREASYDKLDGDGGNKNLVINDEVIFPEVTRSKYNETATKAGGGTAIVRFKWF